MTSLGGSPKSVPKAYCNLATLDALKILKLSCVDLSCAQQKDPCFGEIWRALKKGNLSTVTKEAHKDIPLVMRDLDNLVLDNGVMFWCT